MQYYKKVRKDNVQIQSLIPGTHISYPRVADAYRHHAIFVEVVSIDQYDVTYKVIHLNGTGSEFLNKLSGGTGDVPSIRLEKRSIEEHGKFWSYDYTKAGYDADVLDMLCISEKETLRRAKQCLNETPGQFETYNLISSNCEHFASYCTVELAICKQHPKLTHTEDETTQDNIAFSQDETTSPEAAMAASGEIWTVPQGSSSSDEEEEDTSESDDET